MEGVHIDPAKKSDVDKRIEDCTVPEGARGFWAGADFGKNFSIGSSVQTQLIRYDITKGKASLNSQGIGGGITLRYYNDGWLLLRKRLLPVQYPLKISRLLSQDVVRRRGLLRLSKRIRRPAKLRFLSYPSR